jgi:uncharacterized protein (TIGR03905 family)
MATITFIPKGTCSKSIRFEVENGVVTHCEFTAGCSGNLQALSRLVAGRRAEDVAALLEGIQCQNGTSCPDQLAKALKKYLETISEIHRP